MPGEVEPKEGAEEEAPKDEGHGEEEPVKEEEGQPDETEAKGEEPAEKEAASEDKGEPEPEDKRKRAGGWQRKIERLERMNEQLLNQLGGQRQGQPAAAKPDQTPEEKAAEYIDSLVEKRLTQREEQRQRQTVVSEFQRRTAEVRAQNPDFDDVVLSADMPISPVLEHTLLTSEHGPAIMYQLAKSPAELARLSALPPLDAMREVVRLEAKLSSGTATPKTTKPATRPPVPPTSVNGSAASTRNLDDLPLADYKRAYRSGRR